ncbi:MAG: proton-conducting membrane transporter [Clostridium sp.]|nr:proton-conducting membrane transporter [Clostridium sp.]
MDVQHAVLAIPVLFPLIAGIGVLILNFKDRKSREVYAAVSVIVNALITLLLAVTLRDASFTLLHLNDGVDITLRIDGMSVLFSCLASFIWILATFYSFEYVKHEGHENRYYTFFVCTLGTIIGIGYSANFVTLYMFYEMMTLITFPLVMHSMTPESIAAGKKYLSYSFVGANVALAGAFVLIHYCGTADFVAGGILNPAVLGENNFLFQVILLLTIMGFGCKAGLFPLHAWLPSGHPVAPAPASGVLSGIITKAGVMAIIRVCYFLVGPDYIRGTWVQTTLLCLTLFTVFMGSMLAFKEKLFKKRLAYSSVSQVSYVLFGLMLFNTTGFVGALLHMVSHAVIKNLLFMTAGAIIYMTHKTYVTQFKGIGKEMPVTMWCFAIGSIALIGIPPTCAFVSKWFLATGALQEPIGIFSYLGPIVLLVSALLTAGYLMPVVAEGFFPGADFDYSSLKKYEPNRYMTGPLIILAACSILIGMFPTELINFFTDLAKTIF